MSPIRKPIRPGPGDPEVLLDVTCEDGCLYLVLANDGAATAFGVTVTFKRPVMGAGGEVEVSAAGVWRRLPLLRQGREIRVFLDTARELFARRERRIVMANVEYGDRKGQRFREAFRHDLRIWQDFGEIARG